MPAELIPLFFVVPLLTGGVLLVLGAPRRSGNIVMLAVLGATVAAAIWLIASVTGGTVLVHQVGGWVPGVAIPLAADMLSALMVAFTSFLTLVSAWFGVVSRQADIRFFAPLVLVLTAGVNGALLTADIFNLFVFIEVMLLPSYALIILARRGAGKLMQVTSSRIYVTVNLLTSTIFLAGVGLVYGVAGTVNLAELAGAARESSVVAIATAVALFALSIKAAAVPVHGWLPRSYPFMPATITALFSGLHTKVAIYAIYRIYATMFEGDERYLWVGLVVFSATMVVGVLGAVGENDSRSILSFHMVSQIGYILLGVALFGELGLAAGIFYLLHHMIVKASLFLSTGAVDLRYGRRPLGEVSGLLRREPATAVVFFIAAMSLAGLPPFSGFVAKLSLVRATFDLGHVAVAVTAVVVSLFTLLSMLKIWGKTFLGEPTVGGTPLEDASAVRVRSAAAVGYAQAARRDDGTTASTGRGVGTGDGSTSVRSYRIEPALIAPAAVLALATVCFGIGGEFLMNLAEQAAANLLDTGPYVEAVLG